MKRNPKDNYYTTTNSMVIEDGDTGEQMIFLIDRKNRLVVRSLLEEDIKPFTDSYNGITSKEKREKRRILYENVPDKDSPEYLFCVEKIIGKENRKDPTSIYGLPREPLGLCCRMDEEVFLQGRKNSELGAFLYEFDEKVANSVYGMLQILAKYLKVEKAQVYFVKPQTMVQ